MNQQDCTHTIPPGARSGPVLFLALTWFALRRLGHGCRRAAEVGLTWLERAQQRRRLRELGDHMLRDIGVTRADACAEADKPFWRP